MEGVERVEVVMLLVRADRAEGEAVLAVTSPRSAPTSNPKMQLEDSGRMIKSEPQMQISGKKERASYR